MPDIIYPPGFYAGQKDGSFKAASVVVPILLKIIDPKSVVDVGCGVGPWAAAFLNAGIEDVIGIDGHYVDRSQLMIPADRFIPLDLGTVSGETPFRTFDLAYSVEVAEHLDESRAVHFVDFLTKLAPVVMFGAAVPGQGGRHHVNEQWPSFWAALFDKAGYDAMDMLRPKIWGISGVPFWYQQNTLIFTRRSTVVRSHPPEPVASLVHPVLYQKYRSLLEQATKRIKELETEIISLKSASS